MGRTFRIKLHLRRFGRRHPWIGFSVRSFIIFSATFGGAYGFIAGSRSEVSGYDPHAFAIGVSFLFAIACVALATLSVRLRLMRKKLRKIALHNEAMADRNWELQEAEQRTRRLFESQGDLIILRDSDGRITFVNDAYCELAQAPREALIGSLATLDRSRTGRHRAGIERHADPRPEDRRPARAALDRLARGAGPQRCRTAGGNAERRPRRHRPYRKRTRARPKPATRPMPRAAPSRASSRWPATRSARR